MNKSKNKSGQIRYTCIFFCVLIAVVRLINYLYPYANTNDIYVFLLMNTVCRCGLIFGFLSIGVYIKINDVNLLHIAKNLVLHYILWCGITLIINLFFWYFDNEISVRNILVYIYKCIVGEPGFIWCIYGTALAFIIIHYLKRLNATRLIRVSVVCLVVFMYLNIIGGGTILSEWFLMIFRTFRVPVLYALPFIILGYCMNITWFEKIYKYRLMLLITLAILWVIEVTLIYKITNNFNIYFTSSGILFTILFWGTIIDVHFRNAIKYMKEIKRKQKFFIEVKAMEIVWGISLPAYKICISIFNIYSFFDLITIYTVDLIISFLLARIIVLVFIKKRGEMNVYRSYRKK